MTTSLHEAADVSAVVAQHAFRDVGAARGPGAVGLEVEVLPLRLVGGSPRRVRLHGGRDDAGLLHRLDHIASAQPWLSPRSVGAPLADYALEAGGRLSFEPGGQLEISTGVCLGPSAANREAADALGRLAAELALDGVRLISCGDDPFSATGDVPQQLDAPRYRAMASYLHARGTAGARMMRHTASIQVNLDPGRGEARIERWLVANLAAPLTLATFACSPGPTAVATRALAWEGTDPTRTGLPGSLAHHDDPVGHVTEAALAADVLLVPTGDADAAPGTPGYRFQDWLLDGADGPFGRAPTDDDLIAHLSTLFHEVRPRGALELRSVDALPARWRSVPTTLLAGLLYDDTARMRVLELLVPRRRTVHEDLRLAAREGLADAARCAVAVEVWSYALEGAARLGELVEDDDLDACRSFIDRFTLRGRCPSDELRERLADGVEATMEWMSEPLPSGVNP